MSLKAGIVHYHLRRGGVSRVISNAVSALSRHDVVSAVFSGEKAPDDWADCSNTVVIPALGYTTGEGDDCDTVVEDLMQSAKKLFGDTPDLWHFHNHSIGKNSLFPRIVRSLAEQGFPVLLQIHDFPEDGRPKEYRSIVNDYGDSRELENFLYPDAGHVHYAVLNRRDMSILRNAGLSEKLVHYLPNPVFLDKDDETVKIDESLILYPTRAIRRKNIGELILWSVADRNKRKYALTLSPENPEHIPTYKAWVDFAKSIDAPVEFEYSSRRDIPFNLMLKSAGLIMTTSIAEGFGLAFLEPFLAGRPLFGRLIPEITDEFSEAGVDFRYSYDFLGIPSGWIDMNSFQSKISHGLTGYYSSYGKKISQDDIEACIFSCQKEGMIDFAKLDEELQQSVILRIAESREDSAYIKPCEIPDVNDLQNLAGENASVVRERFDIRNYGALLLDIYEKVTESTPSKIDSLNADAILERFLAPERFYLLRTS